MKGERKRLKSEYRQRERAEARALLILSEPELISLVDYLDSSGTESCDNTPRLTQAWAVANGINPDALAESLSKLGGHCDCEVLANIDPDEVF